MGTDLIILGWEAISNTVNQTRKSENILEEGKRKTFDVVVMKNVPEKQ